MRRDSGHGYSLSDMQTYGAEDASDLETILDALDGGESQRRSAEPGKAWKSILRAPRHALGALDLASVPTDPGVCVVFDGDEPVFVGRASGREGLRGRLRAHRATDTDLSRSALRASVAVDVLGISRWTARQRPSVISEKFIDPVNGYLADCVVAWVVCTDEPATRQLKSRLLAEYVPEYNLEA